MNAVLRPALIYFWLLLVFRLTGKRALGELSSFDLVLILVISEVVSAALLAGDDSLTAAAIGVTTLLFLDLVLSLVKHRWRAADLLLDGRPVVLLRDGETVRSALDAERIDEADILEAARLSHGINRLGDIARATLERRGRISIIPREGLR